MESFSYKKDNINLYHFLIDYFLSNKNKVYKIKQIGGEAVGCFESISNYTNSDGIFSITIKMCGVHIKCLDISCTNNITVYDTGILLRDDIQKYLEEWMNEIYNK